MGGLGWGPKSLFRPLKDQHRLTFLVLEMFLRWGGDTQAFLAGCPGIFAWKCPREGQTCDN